MKKSQELSRKTWKMIAKNLIILAVLVVVAFVGTMSWFSRNTTSYASGISTKTEVTDGLEYYIVAPSSSDQYKNINDKLKANDEYNKANPTETPKNTSWHTGSLTFDFTDPEFKFMEDLFLCEVTGDGQTFNIPKLVQYGEIAYVDPDSDFDVAVSNEDYMSFDIYFRSKTRNDVAIKSNSFIKPTGTINTSDEEGMKNAAIGAVRMSVLNGSNRDLLWIPGANVWYDGLANNGEGELNIQKGDSGFGKGSVYYNGTELTYTGNPTSTHEYFNASSKARSSISSNGSSVIASTDGEYQLGSDKSIVTLSNSDSANGYYYNHVRVNLWVEGEDSEARLKFVGGKFDMSLKFGLASN